MKPPATARTCHSPFCSTRNTPGLSVVSNGSWRGKIPSSPAAPGAMTMSTSSVSTGRLAVTTVNCSGMSLSAHLVDGAFHVEVLLGHVVKLTVQDAAEALHRLRDRDVHPGQARKDLGHDHGLRQEALDLPGARHGELIFIAQLVDAEDGDDVLQVLVALQHALDALRDVVVLLAHHTRVEDRRRRGQRIHGREQGLLEEGAFQVDGGVEMREYRSWSRVGDVVGGHVDG